MTAALRSDETALSALTDLMASSRTSPADRSQTRSYAVLPRPTGPRYVIPVKGRHARGAHIRPGQGRVQDLTRITLKTMLGLGLGQVAPGRLVIDDGDADRPSLRRHLATLLDRDDIDLAVALGAPRPNRKPVIQIIGGDGATVAWAKIGVDAHTDSLVSHETSALQEVAARPGDLVLPPVLAASEWRGHPILALGHIHMDESASALRLSAPVIEAIAGPTVDALVTESTWWTELESAPDPDGAVAALLASLRPQVDGRTWRFGRWHGDLAPWNATWDGDRLVVWDWERSSPHAPVGLDLVHNRFQVAVTRDGADITPALFAAAEAERETFRALGYGDDDITLLARAYAVTMRSRYASDAQHGPIGPCQPIADTFDADPTLGTENR